MAEAEAAATAEAAAAEATVVGAAEAAIFSWVRYLVRSSKTAPLCGCMRTAARTRLVSTRRSNRTGRAGSLVSSIRSRKARSASAGHARARGRRCNACRVLTATMSRVLPRAGGTSRAPIRVKYSIARGTGDDDRTGKAVSLYVYARARSVAQETRHTHTQR